MDFARHAFLARALRSQELVDSARGEWDLALKEVRGKQDLMMLLRSATQWNWRSEQEELLWSIVDQYPRDKAAFRVLAKTLFLEGRTRSLLKLYSEALRRDPADLACKNNVAFAALLLDAQEFKPHEMAREVYAQAPTNSACAATYALSVYLQKKNGEAIKVIEGLGPQALGIRRWRAFMVWRFAPPGSGSARRNTWNSVPKCRFCRSNASWSKGAGWRIAGCGVAMAPRSAGFQTCRIADFQIGCGVRRRARGRFGNRRYSRLGGLRYG